MKKIIAIIILSLMTSFAFAQTTDSVLKFLGIPVDGKKADMIIALEKKGFKYNPRKDELNGEFNGNESAIQIATNHNKVCRIIVIDTNPYDEVQIKRHYNLLIEQFENNKKYFTFEPNTQIPENENISYEIAVNKKQYEAIFHYNPIYNNQAAKDKLYNETIETCKEWLKEAKEPKTKKMYSDNEDFQRLVQETMMLKFTQMIVWFTFIENFGKYYLAIYYDNLNNMANRRICNSWKQTRTNVMQPSFHTFVEYDRINEPLCLSFFETVLRLQIEAGPHGHVSYKDIMPAMHIGRERLQRVLNCIGRNWLYFKIEKGYMLTVSNIVMSIDWSKRFTYRGTSAYHFKVERFN